HSCAAIHDTAGVSSSYRSVFAKGRLQFCQSIHRRLGTPVIVFGERVSCCFAASVLQWHRHEFLLQSSSFVSIVSALLRTQRELILHLASDSLLLAVQF